MRTARVAKTLGAVFRVFSLFLILPLAGSLYWDAEVAPSSIPASLGLPVELKTTTLSFGLTFLFVFLFGVLLSMLTGRTDEALREREAYFIVGAGWFSCSILGAIPFLLVGATQDPIVALFESMSGITTTGFSALPLPLEALPESVHLWRASLQFFGGLSIVAVAVAVIGRLTEGLSKLAATDVGVADASRMRPRLTQTARTLFVLYLVLNLTAFGAFWLALRLAPAGLDWKGAAYHAIVHAIAGIATGGFSTRTDSLAAFGSDVVSWVGAAVMIAGAVNFALYARLRGGGLGVFWRDAEFRFFLAIALLSSAAVVGFLLHAGGSLARSLTDGSIMALTSLTTTGFTVANPDRFPDGAKLIFVFLMVTGGMVGSTVGGIKIGRIMLLFRLSFTELRRLLHPHSISIVKVGGRILPEDTLRRVVVFFFAYVTSLIGGALAFAFLGFDLPSSLVASAASLGNAGFGFGAVALGFVDPVPEAARVVAIGLMWLGRLEIFTVLLLFVRGTYRD